MRISAAAARAGASVFPIAVAPAPRIEALMGTLTANAASAIPGSIRHPPTRKATTATPVGGQIGVTFSSTSDSRRLSWAET